MLEYEVILQHITDPDNSPLTEKQQAQFDRVMQAARLFDDSPDSTANIKLLQEKYGISRSTARQDVLLAQELFKSNHTFDWDFWNAWQLRDLAEKIRILRTSTDKNADRDFINAHKLLREILGEKPANLDDPRRMEKNNYFIQLNNNNTIVNLELDKVKGLSKSDIQTIVETLSIPIDDQQAIELMNT